MDSGTSDKSILRPVNSKIKLLPMAHLPRILALIVGGLAIESYLKSLTTDCIISAHCFPTSFSKRNNINTLVLVLSLSPYCAMG